jgi:hypothetical protein
MDRDQLSEALGGTGMARSYIKRTAGILLLSTLVTGCASVRGGPKSVFDQTALVNAAQQYTVETVADDMPTTGATAQKQYRNKVIQAYLTAIDARYYQFRTDLSVEGRGGALGFDTLILGLATIGSISTGAAPELAAANSFLSGSRAAIDKNLLYEKTLPAIFAAMDANRLRQRTIILARMQEDLGAYPMEAAWNDLQDYQIAGTFDEAVTQITDSAAGDRASARAAYNRARGVACDSTNEVIDVTDQLRDRIDSALTDANDADPNIASRGRLKLEQMANVFDVEFSGRSNDEIVEDVIEIVSLDYCKADTLKKKVDQLLP